VEIAGNVTMSEDSWIGIGSSSERIIFNGSAGFVTIDDAALFISRVGADDGGDITIQGGDNGAGTDYPDWVVDSYQEYFRIALNNSQDGQVRIINYDGTGVASLYVEDDISGESITDRSKLFVGTEAIKKLSAISEKPGTTDGDWAKIDHTSLPVGVKKQIIGSENGRDIGAFCSLLCAAIIELNKKIVERQGT
jgi:hypothetical protein